MPLQTQIIRKGEAREIRWGWFHLSAIIDVLNQEGMTLNDYDYPVKRDYYFLDQEDGEEFWILKGDRIRAWR